LPNDKSIVLTAFVALIIPLYPLFTALISPDVFKNSIAFVTANGMMSQASAARQFTVYSVIKQNVTSTIALGMLYSIIIPLFQSSRKHSKSPARR